MLRKVKLCLRHPALRRYLMLLLSVMINRRPYATDLSDARWALIEPVLSAWRQARAEAGPGLSEPVHDLREIVNAILYVNRAGCAWQLLPHDLPPYRTACGYYARREKDGTTGAIHDLLRGKVREQAGPSPEPTAAITDARVVKTSSSAPEATQGYDAGKRTKGRKQHIATDPVGLLLALVITAASVQDTNCGKGRRGPARRRPSRRGRGLGRRRVQDRVPGPCRRGRHQLRRRPERAGPEGLAPLPRRWAVERTLGWFVLHRRLVRDFETLPERSATMIHWAMTGNMSRRPGA